MTVYGTIFGHDKDNDINTVRKFGAFAGTTWLRHAKAIAETGAASTEPDFGLNGQTLKVVITMDGHSLHHMVVQVDDMISAIHLVKERTLLAAQMEKGNFAGETDEISAMFQDLELGKVGDTAATKANSDAKDEATTATDAKDKEEDPEMPETKGKGPENNAATSSSTRPKARLSKIRILEIRAEAMAEAFKEDICGPNFKMPAEFR